jgi:hypothetical protein
MTQPPSGGHAPDDPRYPAPAYPASDPPFPTSGQPYPGAGPVPGPAPLPTSGQPYPTSGAPDGGPDDDAGVDARPAAKPARRRRLLVGGAVALVLVLCVGGGMSAWLLRRGLDSGEGAPEPAAAVSAFLEAVYADKDTERAADIVCSEARDEAEISAKVAEVRAYDAKYDSPRFEWDDPKVGDRSEDRAVVTVRLKMTTADERTAQQELRFTVVHKTGWWVCEVS